MDDSGQPCFVFLEEATIPGDDVEDDVLNKGPVHRAPHSLKLWSFPLPFSSSTFSLSFSIYSLSSSSIFAVCISSYSLAAWFFFKKSTTNSKHKFIKYLLSFFSLYVYFILIKEGLQQTINCTSCECQTHRLTDVNRLASISLPTGNDKQRISDKLCHTKKTF